jgi:hypothetical protein
MGADPRDPRRLTRLAMFKLGELDIQFYTVFVLRDLSLSDEIMDALPVVRGLVKSGRWVAVVGDKQCIAKLISAAGLREMFTHETPFTAFLLARKDDITQKALGEITNTEIDNDEWMGTQMAVLQNHRGECRLMLGYPMRNGESVLDNLEVWRRILDNYRWVGRDASIDDVIKDVRERLLSGEWLMVSGELIPLYTLQFVSTKRCGTAPTTYVFENKQGVPVYEVSLIKKCGEFLREYNAYELGGKFTEEGFRQLRAIVYTNTQNKGEGEIMEGVTFSSDESVDALTDAIKEIYEKSKEFVIGVGWQEQLLN